MMMIPDPVFLHEYQKQFRLSVLVDFNSTKIAYVSHFGFPRSLLFFGKIHLIILNLGRHASGWKAFVDSLYRPPSLVRYIELLFMVSDSN